MFRFANIEILWWLLTIPVFVVAYVVYTHRKARQLAEFGDPELMAQLMPDASKKRPILKFSLAIVALILLIHWEIRKEEARETALAKEKNDEKEKEEK